MEKPKPKRNISVKEPPKQTQATDVVSRVIAWEREQKAKGIELGPTVEDYVEANRQAMVKNSERVARMTHEELVAEFRRNAARPTIHDDVKILLYLVFAIPKPGSKRYKTVSRYDGYFFCLADNPDPTHLLSELLAKKHAEILVAHHAATGELGCLRGGAAHRDQINESGYALVLEKTVRFSRSKN